VSQLDLGQVRVPMDQYASQGNAVLGIRGSGKSYTATYIAERLLDARVPIVAFDPIGIWRFLRVPAKASGEGYKVVVAGGEHGDIPLPANGAAEIMRAAMRDGVSIVFDLYDIALSKGDWRRVVERR
jgi:DNA helicase HerA-like ATPase